MAAPAMKCDFVLGLCVVAVDSISCEMKVYKLHKHGSCINNVLAERFFLKEIQIKSNSYAPVSEAAVHPHVWEQSYEVIRGNEDSDDQVQQ